MHCRANGAKNRGDSRTSRMGCRDRKFRFIATGTNNFHKKTHIINTTPVYAVHFKCNKKLLHEYSNLFNYTKEIFQIPGLSSTVNIEHIKRHYYESRRSINPFGIIPHDVENSNSNKCPSNFKCGEFSYPTTGIDRDYTARVLIPLEYNLIAKAVAA
ncbi:GST C-terminal domain-containing protein [Forsythia ovata]|uniref:GST C-terminal domain-containing protein n=1 Tax=Forsythia ovata TaxID=205694 RepID=A0ABD1WVR3_9LAMI